MHFPQRPAGGRQIFAITKARRRPRGPARIPNIGRSTWTGGGLHPARFLEMLSHSSPGGAERHDASKGAMHKKMVCSNKDELEMTIQRAPPHPATGHPTRPTPHNQNRLPTSGLVRAPPRDNRRSPSCPQPCRKNLSKGNRSPMIWPTSPRVLVGPSPL